MPELPEVEQVKRSLAPHLIGQKIISSEVKTRSIVGDLYFEAKVAGQEVLDIKRKGKYLLIELTNEYTLVIHLRMTGKVVAFAGDFIPDKHTHVIFHFNTGGFAFADVRKFGRVNLVENSQLATLSGLSTLGMEPISPDFNLDVFEEAVKNRGRSRIKPLILDQKVVAGIGNIYADESLFIASIHPETLLADLRKDQLKALCEAMAKVLNDSIERGGTSFRDYVDGNNEKGDNQNHLQVFQREGGKCPRCGEIILRIKVAGRSSFFCPKCQVK